MTLIKRIFIDYLSKGDMKRACQPKRDTQKRDYKAFEFHTTLNENNYKRMKALRNQKLTIPLSVSKY